MKMTTSTAIATATATATTTVTKPRILCLHGLSQSGATFSQKIGGARRKLARYYDLDFLDAPVRVTGTGGEGGGGGFGWWIRNEQGEHVGVETSFEYIRQQTQHQTYDVLLGFSQGGLLATALALSGDVPGIKAVVTAGSPHVEDAFQIAMARAAQRHNHNHNHISLEAGKAIPKLHFAGETDTIIPVERVEQLSREGGNGTVLKHEKGHLFPTKASEVNAMMEFLETHVHHHHHHQA